VPDDDPESDPESEPPVLLVVDGSTIPVEVEPPVDAPPLESVWDPLIAVVAPVVPLPSATGPPVLVVVSASVSLVMSSELATESSVHA
jgi:hypothetical protein